MRDVPVTPLLKIGTDREGQGTCLKQIPQSLGGNQESVKSPETSSTCDATWFFSLEKNR